MATRISYQRACFQRRAGRSFNVSKNLRFTLRAAKRYDGTGISQCYAGRQKSSGRTIRYILLSELGEALIVDDVSESEIADCL